MPNPVVSTADPPIGTGDLGAAWLTVRASGLGSFIAAVAEPSDPGRSPVALLFHGSHGFAHQYVRLAQELAEAGLLGVAVGWFREGDGAGSRFVTPIVCPTAPPAPDPLSAEAMQIVSALVNAVRGLPNAIPDRIALFGHSRGGGAVLNYILRVGDVQAAILSSSRYPPELAAQAPKIKVPILMLHGTDDRPADGGSETTNIRFAREFERTAVAAGKSVEAVYYEGGRHNGLFDDQAQHLDEVERIVAFLSRHLRPTSP